MISLLGFLERHQSVTIGLGHQELSFLHPHSLRSSRGHFYFAQRGHYHFAATQAVEQLSRLLGINPNMNAPSTGTRPPLEANLKHARLLLFQSQSEIASQKFLFHRQGEPFIPQSIKDTSRIFLVQCRRTCSRDNES